MSKELTPLEALEIIRETINHYTKGVINNGDLKAIHVIETALKMYNKLADLEDLMDEYEIEDVAALKKILKDYDENAIFTIGIMAFNVKKGLTEEFAKFMEDFRKEIVDGSSTK